ncbi:hypothetical protein DPMN_077227 [Dreissena polymorpha]|uniref:Uncharacterized protein n=1 Tax=Dreissena polymorpha TaxID=45954 RepID=A0A9D3YNW3_DREPO|nr:hypothetical protein DPMN_077227 [Dreissena polymorpha]
MSGYSDCKANGRVSVEKAVSDSNLHVMGKPSFSENEHLDRNSTTHDANVGLVEELIYHTINDAVEQQRNVKGDSNDNEYTTSKVVKIEKDTDKIFNKLKLERHVEYNHVNGNYSVHDKPISNHYDTASESVKGNATLASINDEYDHVEGTGRIHVAATSNDCDMTDSVMEVRA